MKRIIFFWGLVSLAIILNTSCQDNKTQAQLEEYKSELQKLDANKAIAERFHSDLFLERKWELANEFLATDIVLHLPGTGDMEGIDAVKSLDAMYASMKNSKINHYEIVAEGDYVVIRWDMSFDNTVDLMGIPATGKRISNIGGMVCIPTIPCQ
jgi:predicted ester cyclase